MARATTSKTVATFLSSSTLFAVLTTPTWVLWLVTTSINLRTTLRTPGLTDEELMKQVNELASQQAERNTKLATEHQKTTKVNFCEVPKGEEEPRTKNPHGDGSQKILSEIRQMKSAINDLQGRVNAQSSQASTPDRGQFPYRGRRQNIITKTRFKGFCKCLLNQ